MGTYATLAEVRAEGLTEQECPDARVTALLESQSRYIDNVTQNFFEVRTQTLFLDGNGKNCITFSTPIISITSLDLVDETGTVITAFAANEYLVYNRHLQGLLSPDDRYNPKIEIISGGNMRPLYRSYLVFAKGLKNVKVVGQFGFTEYNLGVTANGITPNEIKEVCIRLVIRKSARMADYNRDRVRRQQHRVSSETSDSQTYVMERQGIGAFTGDMDIDKILLKYRSRVGVVVA